MRAWFHEGVSWAGLAVGPAAWAVSTQVNYSLVSILCGHRLDVRPLAIVALVLILLSLASGLVSWRAWRRHGTDEQIPELDGRPRNLLAGLGVLAALLFALVIAAQGAAALVLQGCER
jgi:uncharacterized membrane protein